MRYIIVVLTLITLLSARDEYADKRWGVAMVWGNYSIPYANESVDDKMVLNAIPLFYYEGERFYMHGTDYGIKLYEYKDWQFSALGRLRLLNIPKEYQNEVQGDKVDFGLRSRYFLTDNQYIDIELMENHDRDRHANLTYSANIEYDNLYLEPYTTLRLKDDTFNSHYYGLDIEEIEGDIFDTQMTSIFYGYPLSSSLFNLPMDIYLSTGFALHHNSEVQNRVKELDLLFKLYYTLPIPYVDIRLGFGEGVSYITDVVYIEELEMIEKGYRPSEWMNYLDISGDIGLEAFDDRLDSLSVGVAIHHRSAIYEQSSLFGRIRGGTNYTTLYLQWELYHQYRHS